MTNIDRNLLKLAAQQVLARKLSLKNENTGAVWFNPLMKAKDEIKLNDSILFDGELLTFVSRESGKDRKVTENGCDQSCDCKGAISYHRAMFAILTRYTELYGEQLAQTALENARREVEDFCPPSCDAENDLRQAARFEAVGGSREFHDAVFGGAGEFPAMSC